MCALDKKGWFHFEKISDLVMKNKIGLLNTDAINGSMNAEA
jgi:hypothetical protein